MREFKLCSICCLVVFGFGSSLPSDYNRASAKVHAEATLFLLAALFWEMCLIFCTTAFSHL